MERSATHSDRGSSWQRWLPQGFLPRLGLLFLVTMLLVCLGTLPLTLGRGPLGVPRITEGATVAAKLPPWWLSANEEQSIRLNSLVPTEFTRAIAAKYEVSIDEAVHATSGPVADEMRDRWDRTWLGTDALGRSVLVRCLAGGGISLGVGLCAAMLSVFIGTLWGATAGYLGGKIDGVMMRTVDVLYGLPYVLLVVLLAVASDAVVDEWVSQSKARAAWVQTRVVEAMEGEGIAAPQKAAIESWVAKNGAFVGDLRDKAKSVRPPRNISEPVRTALDLVTLFIAIGGVSWLTMARVIRGQVLSLKSRPFIEAARAVGAGPVRIFVVHLLPNLVAPIVVYATLTVPQAILQESFLSFLGIGVKPPMPSWGNLASEGLGELNPYQSNWWLLVFPCGLLALTLLALNFVGEGLREAFDPRQAQRKAGHT